MPLVEVSNNKVWFHCPGCECTHAMLLDRWDYNGNDDLPTIWPSIVHEAQFRCHAWVRNRRIQFLPDSTHSLSGRTVSLEEFK